MTKLRLAALAVSFAALAGTAGAAAPAPVSGAVPMKPLLAQQTVERVRVSPLMVYAVQSTHEASRKT